MGQIVVVNAPPLFAAVSRLVMGLLHNDTKSKVKVFPAVSVPRSDRGAVSSCVPGFIGADAAAFLRALCGEDLPPELGGTLPPNSPPYCY